MAARCKLTWILAIAGALVLAACNGGGGGTDPVTITSINVTPLGTGNTVSAGSIVELTATISAPGQNTSSLNKNWTVSTGTLSVEPPDFSLTLRQIAKTGSATSVSTSSVKIYWSVPATPGPATIDLDVSGAQKSLAVTIGASALTLSIADGASGTKIVTISANGVTDLYQAAFRVKFSSAWAPVEVQPRDFLGTPGEILWMGLTNQTGFVPVSITRRGNVAGKDGSGALAQVSFIKPQSTSQTREVSDLPFVVDSIVLRNSHDQPIN